MRQRALTGLIATATGKIEIAMVLTLACFGIIALYARVARRTHAGDVAPGN